jgi:hypothetical protein
VGWWRDNVVYESTWSETIPLADRVRVILPPELSKQIFLGDFGGWESPKENLNC